MAVCPSVGPSVRYTPMWFETNRRINVVFNTVPSIYVKFYRNLFIMAHPTILLVTFSLTLQLTAERRKEQQIFQLQQQKQELEHQQQLETIKSQVFNN